MKSPQVALLGVEDPENYSDMKVMKSGAGYYIGTTYSNPDGFEEPGSRDSVYFGNYGEAENLLNFVENNPTMASLFLRMYP